MDYIYLLDNRNFTFDNNNNKYKLINEDDGMFLYYCKNLNKYKIVNHKKGIETLFKIYDLDLNKEMVIC